MFANLRQARRMGNAVVIGISGGRNSSSIPLQRSRGLLLSSASPIFADSSSSFVASASCFCSRQVFAHFSSSTAGHRSCSTAGGRNSIRIEEGGSHPKRGGSQDTSMALTTSEQAAPTNEMKSEEVMEKAALGKVIDASAMVSMTSEQASFAIGTTVEEVMEKVIKKNMMEVKRGFESVTDKLGEMQVRLEKLENGLKSPNKAMKKVERGIEELRKKFDDVDVKPKGLKCGYYCSCSDTEDEDYYTRVLKDLKMNYEEKMKRRKRSEAEAARIARRDISEPILFAERL